MSLLDHTGFMVKDMARSKAFYERALKPLGVTVIMDFGNALGMGRDGKPSFWLAVGPASYQKPEHMKLITPAHLAFAARSRAEVDAFYVAAIEAGGTDFGKPGLRPEYHPNYYGAFVLDLDGHNIEAVYHDPV